MEQVKIETLKKGAFLKLSPTSSVVYVYDGYNRFTKKYSYYAFNDINHFGEKKKGTLITIGFDF